MRNIQEFQPASSLECAFPVLEYSTSLSSSSSCTSDPYAGIPHAQPGIKHARRSSQLTLFSKFPKDFSFIRTSRRQSLLFQPGESRAPAPVPLPSTRWLGQANEQPQSMENSAKEHGSEERFARRLERKFYNFIRRSRSRSRSKADHSESVERESVPELPEQGSSQGEILVVGHSEVPPLVATIDYSKPPTRIPSRPLSSATTATNATITPPTPTQNRSPRKLPPDRPGIASQGNVLPRRSSSQPSSARNRFHHPLGYPNHTRKGSGSLPTPDSSEASLDALPLSSSVHPRTIPDSSQELPSSSSSSVPEDTQTTSKSRPSAFSKLDFFRKPKFFSNASGLLKSNSTKRHASSPAQQLTSHQPGVPPDLYPVMSAPATVPPPVITPRSELDLYFRDTQGANSTTHYRPLHIHSTDHASSSSSTTPFLARRSSKPSYPHPTFVIPPTSHRSPRDDVHGLKHRHRSVHVIGEESVEGDFTKRGRQPSRERGNSPKRVASPKISGGTNKEKERATPRERVVIAVTSQERPRTGDVDSKIDVRRSGTQGSMLRTPSAIANGRTKHGSFDFEKPVWGRVATTSLHTGNARSKDSLHGNGRSVIPGMKSHENKFTHGLKAYSGSLSTNLHRSGSATQNPTSSTTFGRTNSRRSTRPGHVAGIGTSHGPFDFEPVVPPSIISEASGSSTSNSEPGLNDTEKYERKVGRRGQSLDLRLGLAWAPTKVKEEALLPFGRTISRDSTTRQQTSVERPGTNFSSSSDVTQAFRDALGEAGFAKFKRYVHRFDAQAIPFDGPSGIVTRVERLLGAAPSLDQEGKRELLDRFVRIILQNA